LVAVDLVGVCSSRCRFLLAQCTPVDFRAPTLTGELFVRSFSHVSIVIDNNVLKKKKHRRKARKPSPSVAQFGVRAILTNPRKSARCCGRAAWAAKRPTTLSLSHTHTHTLSPDNLYGRAVGTSQISVHISQDYYTCT